MVFSVFITYGGVYLLSAHSYLLKPLLLSVYGIKLVGARAMAHGYKFYTLYFALTNICEYIEYVSQRLLALVVL